ncbi:MAG: hypothetical protein KBC12_02825 [Candidatus Pacebacteria bacterium]|nr:hypothetical protein [Candidatus Paceibacterota bacterium]MBP9851374.1 hypothetical protein [Candidatus Paceibacterota bacterium]
MKFKKGYIAVYGDTLPIKIDRFLMGGKKEMRASTWPPFIFFADEKFEESWIVNHELIHLRQTYDLLFIGVLVLYVCEQIYARIFLNMSAYEAYHYSALEQEAYLHHNDPEYLKHRKLFSVFKYIRNKKKFSMDKDGIVIIQN